MKIHFPACRLYVEISEQETEEISDNLTIVQFASSSNNNEIRISKNGFTSGKTANSPFKINEPGSEKKPRSFLLVRRNPSESFHTVVDGTLPIVLEDNALKEFLGELTHESKRGFLSSRGLLLDVSSSLLLGRRIDNGEAQLAVFRVVKQGGTTFWEWTFAPGSYRKNATEGVSPLGRDLKNAIESCLFSFPTLKFFEATESRELSDETFVKFDNLPNDGSIPWWSTNFSSSRINLVDPERPERDAFEFRPQTLTVFRKVRNSKPNLILKFVERREQEGSAAPSHNFELKYSLTANDQNPQFELKKAVDKDLVLLNPHPDSESTALWIRNRAGYCKTMPKLGTWPSSNILFESRETGISEWILPTEVKDVRLSLLLDNCSKIELELTLIQKDQEYSVNQVVIRVHDPATRVVTSPNAVSDGSLRNPDTPPPILEQTSGQNLATKPQQLVWLSRRLTLNSSAVATYSAKFTYKDDEYRFQLANEMEVMVWCRNPVYPIVGDRDWLENDVTGDLMGNKGQLLASTSLSSISALRGLLPFRLKKSQDDKLCLIPKDGFIEALHNEKPVFTPSKLAISSTLEGKTLFCVGADNRDLSRLEFTFGDSGKVLVEKRFAMPQLDEIHVRSKVAPEEEQVLPVRYSHVRDRHVAAPLQPLPVKALFSSSGNAFNQIKELSEKNPRSSPRRSESAVETLKIVLPGDADPVMYLFRKSGENEQIWNLVDRHGSNQLYLANIEIKPVRFQKVSQTEYELSLELIFKRGRQILPTQGSILTCRLKPVNASENIYRLEIKNSQSNGASGNVSVVRLTREWLFNNLLGYVEHNSDGTPSDLRYQDSVSAPIQYVDSVEIEIANANEFKLRRLRFWFERNGEFFPVQTEQDLVFKSSETDPQGTIQISGIEDPPEPCKLTCKIEADADGNNIFNEISFFIKHKFPGILIKENLMGIEETKSFQIFTGEDFTEEPFDVEVHEVAGYFELAVSNEALLASAPMALAGLPIQVDCLKRIYLKLKRRIFDSSGGIAADGQLDLSKGMIGWSAVELFGAEIYSEGPQGDPNFHVTLFANCNAEDMTRPEWTVEFNGILAFKWERSGQHLKARLAFWDNEIGLTTGLDNELLIDPDTAISIACQFELDMKATSSGSRRIVRSWCSYLPVEVNDDFLNFDCTILLEQSAGPDFGKTVFRRPNLRVETWGFQSQIPFQVIQASGAPGAPDSSENLFNLVRLRLETSDRTHKFGFTSTGKEFHHGITTWRDHPLDEHKAKPFPDIELVGQAASVDNDQFGIEFFGLTKNEDTHYKVPAVGYTQFELPETSQEGKVAFWLRCPIRNLSISDNAFSNHRPRLWIFRKGKLSLVHAFNHLKTEQFENLNKDPSGNLDEISAKLLGHIQGLAHQALLFSRWREGAILEITIAGEVAWRLIDSPLLTRETDLEFLTDSESALGRVPFQQHSDAFAPMTTLLPVTNDKMANADIKGSVNLTLNLNKVGAAKPIQKRFGPFHHEMSTFVSADLSIEGGVEETDRELIDGYLMVERTTPFDLDIVKRRPATMNRWAPNGILREHVGHNTVIPGRVKLSLNSPRPGELIQYRFSAALMASSESGVATSTPCWTVSNDIMVESRTLLPELAGERVRLNVSDYDPPESEDERYPRPSCQRKNFAWKRTHPAQLVAHESQPFAIALHSPDNEKQVFPNQAFPIGWAVNPGKIGEILGDLTTSAKRVWLVIKSNDPTVDAEISLVGSGEVHRSNTFRFSIFESAKLIDTTAPLDAWINENQVCRVMMQNFKKLQDDVDFNTESLSWSVSLEIESIDGEIKKVQQTLWEEITNNLVVVSPDKIANHGLEVLISSKSGRLSPPPSVLALLKKDRRGWSLLAYGNESEAGWSIEQTELELHWVKTDSMIISFPADQSHTTEFGLAMIEGNSNYSFVFNT